MPPQSDQPSLAGENTLATKIDITPPLEQRRQFAESNPRERTSESTTIRDNNLVVPPLFTNVQYNGTMDGIGQPKFLNITNPYDSWGLEVTRQRWTDLAQTVPSASPERRGALTREEVDRALRPASADASPAERSRPEVADVNERQTPTHKKLEATDVHNQKVLDSARNAVDQRVWKGSQFERATAKGKFGGAASVSVLLQEQGYDYANSASVSQLTKSMLANGWELVSVNDAKPGDIIFGGKVGTNWRKGGGNGRVGIVGEDGKVYNNNSKTGKWTLSEREQVFGREFGDQVWALRPPAEGPQGQPVTRDTARDDTTVERRRSRRREYEQPRSTERDETRNRRDYRDFRGRERAGRDDGRYPTQFGDSDINLSDFNPVNILRNAIDGIGKALWALTPFRHSVNNGRLGCAASVSEVLQRSGYRYANHAGVGGLESQLMRNGWRKAPLSSAKPGDVVMIGRSQGWRAGGGAAHVGIVGENGRVYHNNSARGKWIEDNLHARFGGGIERFVLKPPSNGSHKIDPRNFEYRNPEPEVNPTRRGDRRQARGDSRPDRSDAYESRGYGRDRGYNSRDYQARYQQDGEYREEEDGRNRRSRRRQERDERHQEEASERRNRRHRRSRRH